MFGACRAAAPSYDLNCCARSNSKPTHSDPPRIPIVRRTQARPMQTKYFAVESPKLTDGPKPRVCVCSPPPPRPTHAVCRVVRFFCVFSARAAAAVYVCECVACGFALCRAPRSHYFACVCCSTRGTSRNPYCEQSGPVEATACFETTAPWPLKLWPFAVGNKRALANNQVTARTWTCNRPPPSLHVRMHPPPRRTHFHVPCSQVWSWTA